MSPLHDILLGASRNDIPVIVECNVDARGWVLHVDAQVVVIRHRTTSEKVSVGIRHIRRVTRFDGRQLWPREEADGAA